MRAVIRSFDSSDVDLDDHHSEDPFDDAVWLRMYVGPADGRGEESFDVCVCTPLWLKREVEKHGARVIRHTLLMPRLDVDQAKKVLEAEISRLDGDTWDELARKIGELGYWEFQDYRPG